jgi:drug/metabolite transporter (DMT)-like permease
MAISRVTGTAARVGAAWPDARELLAFAAIYVLWGATFLAIRVAVLEIPPFFTAGARFLLAGGLLYLFMRLRGERAPTAAEWRGIAVTALCLFVATYAALFWAEQYVPSGLTSVIEASMPLTTIVLEVFVFRLQPFRWRLLASVALGFGGIAWLLARGDAGRVALLPCLVILAGGFAWSLGAVLTRSMPKPQSLPLTAGAQMMLGGAVLLAISLASGELHSAPHVSLRAGLAVLYLIVGGSWVGFTAYVWLLARMPVTRVASHAYVNPLVAVALGYLLAGEEFTLRMLLASLVVVASVFLILTSPQRRARRPSPVASPDRREGGRKILGELEVDAVGAHAHLREDRARLLAQAREDHPRAVAPAALEQRTQRRHAARIDERHETQPQDEHARRLRKLVEHVVETVGDGEEQRS